MRSPKKLLFRQKGGLSNNRENWRQTAKGRWKIRLKILWSALLPKPWRAAEGESQLSTSSESTYISMEFCNVIICFAQDAVTSRLDPIRVKHQHTLSQSLCRFSSSLEITVVPRIQIWSIRSKWKLKWRSWLKQPLIISKTSTKVFARRTLQ